MKTIPRFLKELVAYMHHNIKIMLHLPLKSSVGAVRSPVVSSLFVYFDLRAKNPTKTLQDKFYRLLNLLPSNLMESQIALIFIILNVTVNIHIIGRRCISLPDAYPFRIEFSISAFKLVLPTTMLNGSHFLSV